MQKNVNIGCCNKGSFSNKYWKQIAVAVEFSLGCGWHSSLSQLNEKIQAHVLIIQVILQAYNKAGNLMV